nr:MULTISPECIES: hypothetical protein [Halobacillus]
MGYILVILLLAGCGAGASQRAIQDLTSTMENELHIVYFYEQERPSEQMEAQLTGMKVFLARKNIPSSISYRKIDGEKNYEELLGVKDGQILVFDYKGIRFNARNIHVLEGMILQLSNP